MLKDGSMDEGREVGHPGGTRCSLAQSGPNSEASCCRFFVAASRMENT